MFRVRSQYLSHVRPNRVINSTSSSRRPFQQATADQPNASNIQPQTFWTPETKANWLNEELETFQDIAYKSWLGITSWSLIWWLVWCNLFMFFSLIIISDEKETTKLDIPLDLGSLGTGSVADMYKQVIQAREYLEEVCYRKILSSRQYLVDMHLWFKGYAFVALLSCFSYNFYMGHLLKINEPQNLILSAKRLLRRRGFAWHALAIGYSYVLYGTVESYYDTYILTPQLRGLSLNNDSKRDLFSAYGGKGLALNRIIKEGDSEVHFDIQPNELLCALAKQVAIHKTVRPIRTSVVPVQSALFTSNWGVKYRSAKLHDDIPERCWFREPHIAVAYQTALKQQSEKDRKKSEREEKRRQWQAKRRTEVSPGPQKSERKKEEKSSVDSSDKEEARQPPKKFQVGKCFGGSSKEERFLKAAQLEINKAAVARLGVVDLLVSINNITDKVKSADSFLDSISTSFEYFNLLGKFTKNRSHIEMIKCQSKYNHEEYCLCNYYPYYGGYFA